MSGDGADDLCGIAKSCVSGAGNNADNYDHGGLSEQRADELGPLPGILDRPALWNDGVTAATEKQGAGDRGIPDAAGTGGLWRRRWRRYNAANHPFGNAGRIVFDRGNGNVRYAESFPEHQFDGAVAAFPTIAILAVHSHDIMTMLEGSA